MDGTAFLLGLHAAVQEGELADSLARSLCSGRPICRIALLFFFPIGDPRSLSLFVYFRYRKVDRPLGAKGARGPVVPSKIEKKKIISDSAAGFTGRLGLRM